MAKPKIRNPQVLAVNGLSITTKASSNLHWIMFASKNDFAVISCTSTDRLELTTLSWVDLAQCFDIQLVYGNIS